jgi:DNA-binding NtrC family response regulator
MRHYRNATENAFEDACGRGLSDLVRSDHVEAEKVGHESCLDLVVIALHMTKLEDTVAYSERLSKRHPTLPILLLTDHALFVSAWNR